MRKRFLKIKEKVTMRASTLQHVDNRNLGKSKASLGRPHSGLSSVFTGPAFCVSPLGVSSGHLSLDLEPTQIIQDDLISRSLT